MGDAKSRFQAASAPSRSTPFQARARALARLSEPHPTPAAAGPLAHGPPACQWPSPAAPAQGAGTPAGPGELGWQALFLLYPRAWAQRVTPPVSPSDRTGPASPPTLWGTSALPTTDMQLWPWTGRHERAGPQKPPEGQASQMSNLAYPFLTHRPLAAAWDRPFLYLRASQGTDARVPAWLTGPEKYPA